MKLKFDVTAAEYGIMRDVLSAYLAADCRVWVFGSRAKHSTRFNSDCDLAIECTTPLPQQTRIALNEAFDDAKLAFSVDIVDMKTVEPYFKQIIDSHKVEFPLARKAPSLRFPEFNGEWEEKMLGELADITTGNKDTQNKVDDGIYPFFVRSQTVEKINSYSYDGEAILTSGDGVGVGKNFHYIQGKFDFHQRVYCIYKFKNEVFGKFIFHFFSEKFHKRVMRLSAKNSVDSVRRDMIFEMEIYTPTLNEQTKIAAFLSTVDSKIDQLSQKKALLEQYKKGVMQQIFSQHIRFKADDGCDYPEWEEKKLGDVGITYNGLTGKTADDFGKGFPYIQYKQIFDKSKIDVSKFGFVSIGANDKQNMVCYGDIFFTVSSETPNEVGYASVLLDDVDNLYLNSFCFGYRPNKLLLDSSFSQYLFRSNKFRKKVIPLAQGSTRYNISKTEFIKLTVMLPCLSEQTKIAAFLSAIDSKIEQVAQQLAGAKQFKKGLLQQMFV